MEFELEVRPIANGSFAIQLLRFHEDIFEPAQAVQGAKICRNSRCVKAFSGMNRELRFCRFRGNAFEPDEGDFVDDGTDGHDRRNCGPHLNGGIAFLRVREDRADNQQPKKRHGRGSAHAHAFPAPGSI
jgi:hypothetical protein